MHVQRVIQLISHLEQTPPENFSMAYWFSKPGRPEKGRAALHKTRLGHRFQNWCGTAACIAGHNNLARKAPQWFGSTAEGEWLGLTTEERNKLFVPWRGGHLSTEQARSVNTQYGHNRALNTLRHMVVQHAATGQTVINWNAPKVTPEVYAAALNPVTPAQPLPESLTSLLRPEPKAPVTV